eukprot:2425675-Pleurochrysis_carterae.AAC.1
MATWAQGIVWDCADPARCVPVKKLTRRTRFPGPRQVDRAALRAAAASMGWRDQDIIDQVGEGGVEARSECEL